MLPGQDQVKLRWKSAGVARIHDPAQRPKITHMMPYGEQSYLPPPWKVHAGREPLRVNAVRDTKHPFRTEPTLEIRKLTMRHHHGRIDAIQQLLVKQFKAVPCALNRQVEGGDERTRQPRTLPQQQIQLLVAV